MWFMGLDLVCNYFGPSLLYIAFAVEDLEHGCSEMWAGHYFKAAVKFVLVYFERNCQRSCSRVLKSCCLQKFSCLSHVSMTTSPTSPVCLSKLHKVWLRNSGIWTRDRCISLFQFNKAFFRQNTPFTTVQINWDIYVLWPKVEQKVH